MAYVFLAGIVLLAPLAVFGSAFFETERIKKVLVHGAAASKTKVSKAIGTFILVAQVSELAKSIEHVSLVSILATLLLTTMWFAGKSGAENEIN